MPACVTVEDVAELQPVKTRHGVPAKLQSCHTALAGGYVVEGHVPADLIERLLRERPKVAGVAVSGMPVGSPGMEGPGGRVDRYEVLTFDRSGKTGVFATRCAPGAIPAVPPIPAGCPARAARR